MSEFAGKEVTVFTVQTFQIAKKNESKIANKKEKQNENEKCR